MKPQRLIRLSVLLCVVSITLLCTSNSALAKVTGPCGNCHTMHNSQDGSSVEGFAPFEPGDTANRTLLVTTCVGCHTGTNTGTNTIPYVYSTSVPTFGGNTLAGGNFYWVAQGGAENDTKGHNVLGIASQDNNITAAEAAPGGSLSGCSVSCHKTLAAELSGEAATIAAWYGWKNGCQGCHMIAMNDITAWHHADDGAGTKYVDSAAKGWFRFLGGHYSGMTKGVKGIEHEKWNYGATASSHNEYLGVHDIDGGIGFALGYTTTAFCTGCHGLFHNVQKSGGNWIRHPSDAVIPDSGEYASISTTYDVNVPVARPSGFSWTGGPIGTVAAGTDMVMCLSCHVAHGSPYDDLLRWDYNTMKAGGGGADGTGCFVCHTGKDDF